MYWQGQKVVISRYDPKYKNERAKLKSLVSERKAIKIDTTGNYVIYKILINCK